jgi:DNA primase large subunit
LPREKAVKGKYFPLCIKILIFEISYDKNLEDLERE